MQFADNLFLDDSADVIKARSTSPFNGFDVEFRLRDNEIALLENGKTTTIPVNKDSIILITVDQRSGYKATNTTAAMYVQYNSIPVLVYTFMYNEPITDLRKTKTYLLTEHLAQIVSTRYGIKWEYKITIDTKATKLRFYLVLGFIVIVWMVVMVLAFLNRSK